MCILFVRRILMDIHYILIGKLHSDYMCPLFPLLVLGVFIVLVVLNAIFISVFMNNFVIVLLSDQNCVKVTRL
jgi:hypothetical protein